ncbi:MAG TPA: NUDIX hydrolase [Candidatus Saccharimonadales bacterium]|nr:NUDIX hydrolase [Candidatus Saccharimonadales bacterium]
MSLWRLLGRLLSPFAIVLFWVYNRTFRTVRPRVLLFDEDGRVLLVRSWTGYQEWELPGGGCKKGETPLAAAVRELYEETGVRAVSSELILLGEMYVHGYRAPVYVAHHIGDVTLTLDPWEITSFQWCDPSQLPLKTGPIARWAVMKNVQK